MTADINAKNRMTANKCIHDTIPDTNHKSNNKKLILLDEIEMSRSYNAPVPIRTGENARLEIMFREGEITASIASSVIHAYELPIVDGEKERQTVYLRMYVGKLNQEVQKRQYNQ